MSKQFRRFFAATLISGTSLLAIETAFAMDAQQMVDEVVEMASKKGFDIKYDKLEQPDENSIVLEGISVGHERLKSPATIERARFEGIDFVKDEYLVIENYTINGGSLNGVDKLGKSYSASLNELSATGFFVPAPDNLSYPVIPTQHSSFIMNDFKYSKEGKEFVSVPSAEGKNDCNDEKTVCDATFSANQFSLDISENKNAQLKERMKILGLENTIVADVKGGYHYEIESGLFDVKALNLAVNEVGALGVSLSLNGLNEEVIKEYRKLQYDLAQKAKETPSKPMTQNTQMAVMGLLSKLNLNSALIRFDDGSATNKILDMQAASMGSTREEMAAGMPMMAAMGLAQLENPEFTQATINALTAFFADPGNIAVVAKPENPVPMGEIIGTAMAAPKTLIQLLNVTVLANQ